MNAVKNISFFTISLLLVLYSSFVHGMELFEAVKKSDVGAIKKLIETCPEGDREAFVNQQQGPSGWTPLHVAARFDCPSGVVQILVDSGANVNQLAHDDGAAPLHEAALYSSYWVVIRLIKAGADVNKQDTRNGRTPLHWATCRCGWPCIDALIGAGANIDQRDYKGKTPLHDVALFGHNLQGAKALIFRGANPFIEDTEEHCTPLQLAKKYVNQYSSKRMVDFLAHYEQNIREAQQKAQEVTLVLELALFDFSEKNQSPLAELPGDLCLLREIIGLSSEAILQDARLKTARLIPDF